MNKLEFLTTISEAMQDMPHHEVKKSMDYYSEIIDDKTELGMSEEEAVASLGDIDDIVREIMMDISLPNLISAKVKPNSQLKSWKIWMISPLFIIALPLFLSLILLIFVVYLLIWMSIVTMYLVNLSVALACIVEIILAIVAMTKLEVLNSIFALGFGIFLLGSSILLFIICQFLTTKLINLSSIYMRWVKSKFSK